MFRKNQLHHFFHFIEKPPFCSDIFQRAAPSRHKSRTQKYQSVNRLTGGSPVIRRRRSPAIQYPYPSSRWRGVSKNKAVRHRSSAVPRRDKRRNYAKRFPRRLANDCKCGGKKDDPRRCLGVPFKRPFHVLASCESED